MVGSVSATANVFVQGKDEIHYDPAHQHTYLRKGPVTHIAISFFFLLEKGWGVGGGGGGGGEGAREFDII